MPPADRETHSTPHIPRSDNLPDRSAPCVPLRDNNRQSPSAPVAAKNQPSRYSNTLRRRESKTVCEAPSSKLLHHLRTRTHPATRFVTDARHRRFSQGAKPWQLRQRQKWKEIRGDQA